MKAFLAGVWLGVGAWTGSGEFNAADSPPVPTAAETVFGCLNQIPPEGPEAREARLRQVAARRAGTPIMVHRGATRFASENTLKAYADAMVFSKDDPAWAVEALGRSRPSAVPVSPLLFARWPILTTGAPAGHGALALEDTSQGSTTGTPAGGAVFSTVKVRDLRSPTNVVRLMGKSLGDDAGPFLGLGVSYFQALRHAKYDRDRLNRNLALFAAKGFNYVRILSMVSWDGLEIAPVTFTNRAGRVIAAWPDYWSQFRDLLSVTAQHGLRAEVTIFADAQYVMPSQTARQAHLDGILANIAGRESQLLHLEVANEAWQNGFPGAPGIAGLRAFTQYLADRTPVLVAITSNDDTSEQGIIALHRGSAADLATVHFSRDTRSPEGGWLPVRDAYRAGDLAGVPPVSSNEPIGPGSSVSSESDPLKLCAAAVFAYIANLPAYVYHSRAGVYGYVKCCPPAGGEDRFEDTPGIDAFQFVRRILPPDLASWTRNDGVEPNAPFTIFFDDQPNRYWTEARGAAKGCLRNIGSTKGDEFVCFPMGILAGGVRLEARRPVQFQVFNPLTGVALTNLTMKAAERFTLPPGPGAYLLKGTFRRQ